MPKVDFESFGGYSIVVCQQRQREPCIVATQYLDRVMPYAELQEVVGRTARRAVIRYLNKHGIDWRPDADGNPVVSLSAWNARLDGEDAALAAKRKAIANVNWDAAS